MSLASRMVMVLVVIAVAGAACSDSESADDNVFVVSFGGSECRADDVPTQLPAGSYTFVLTILDDDTKGDFGIRRFAGVEENITEEEANALWQEAGGDGAYPFMPWRVSLESAYQDLGAERLELEPNQDQYDFILEPGSHWMRVYTPGPSAHWRCGFLTVTAS